MTPLIDQQVYYEMSFTEKRNFNDSNIDLYITVIEYRGKNQIYSLGVTIRPAEMLWHDKSGFIVRISRDNNINVKYLGCSGQRKAKHTIYALPPPLSPTVTGLKL